MFMISESILSISFSRMDPFMGYKRHPPPPPPPPGLKDIWNNKLNVIDNDRDIRNIYIIEIQYRNSQVVNLITGLILQKQLAYSHVWAKIILTVYIVWSLLLFKSIYIDQSTTDK